MKENSVRHCTGVYWENEVDSSPVGTIRAKKADLALLLSFFGDVVGNAHAIERFPTNGCASP